MRTPSLCLFSILSLATLACHGTGDTKPAALDAVAAQTDAGVKAPAPELAPLSATLSRGQPHGAKLREVFLDPRGRAALTLDVDGGVRLWPTLDAGAPTPELEPYTIPVDEPLSMSLAQHAQAGAFTLAFIDNSNATRVYMLAGADAGAPTLVERFVIGPEDPQLEVHVLDGGQRILTLGVDHRVRLFDAAGELLSAIDQRSFAPWQLRVAGGVGQAPKLLAVLAQPPRVQALALDGDTLSIRGQARTIELDRGPNLNDLQLSPDGKTVLTLRRPRAKGRGWSIELIDLDTDARKLLAGRADTLVRPRMLVVDAERILLESGSGKGFWLPLAGAVALDNPTDAHPDSKFADKLAKRSNYEKLSLLASAEDPDELPDGDTGVRMHTSVRNGVRAAINLRDQAQLLIDPLDEPASFELAHASPRITVGGLSADGALAVWASDTELFVDAIDGQTARTHAHELREPFALAVVDAGHALLASKRKAALIDLDSGAITAEAKTEVDWSVTSVETLLRDGAWQIGYADSKPSAPLRLIECRDGVLHDVRTIETSERSTWLNLTEGRDVDEWAQRGASEFYTLADSRTALHVATGGQEHTIELAAGQARELWPSPDGSLLAVLQFRPREVNVFGRFGDDSDLILSVIDIATGERLWTRGLADRHSTRAVWSPDGRRLAAIHGSAFVYDARSGELLLERSSSGLQLGVH